MVSFALLYIEVLYNLVFRDRPVGRQGNLHFCSNARKTTLFCLLRAGRPQQQLQLPGVEGFAEAVHTAEEGMMRFHCRIAHAIAEVTSHGYIYLPWRYAITQ